MSVFAVRTVAAASWVSSAVTPVSALADVVALITNLGIANTTIGGFYDRRIGVTAPGNTVSSWADCRNLNPGPTLSVNSGTAPTVSGSQSPVTFGAGGATLGCAANATFGSVNCTVVAVASSTVSGAISVLGGANSGAGKSECFCAIDSTNVYCCRCGNTTTDVLSLVANSSTVRCIAASVNSAGTTGFVQVYNQSQVSGSGLTSTSVASTFTAGGANNNANASIACVFSALIYVNTVLTTTQVQTIGAWAVANHAAVAA